MVYKLPYVPVPTTYFVQLYTESVICLASPLPKVEKGHTIHN